MRQRWEAFMSADEWAEIKRETNSAYDDQADEVREKLLLLADYSPAV
jgi:hypothetical protein